MNNAEKHTKKYISVGLLIIGNEVLCGFIKEQNCQFIIDTLVTNGYILDQIRISKDCTDSIKGHIIDISHNDIIITTGGIGMTHDDITGNAICQVYGEQNMKHQYGLQAPSISEFLETGYGFITKQKILSLPGSPKYVRENLIYGLNKISNALSNTLCISHDVQNSLDNNQSTDYEAWQYQSISVNAPEGKIKDIVNQEGIGVYSNGKNNSYVLFYTQEAKAKMQNIVDNITAQGIKVQEMQVKNITEQCNS